MKKRCANSALPLARIGKEGPPAEGKRIEHSESHKMQLEQLKKNVGRHFRIRPITERWDDTGQLDSRDDRWSLDNVDVKANHIKITNLSTGYSKEIGGDNVREYRSPDFLILHCQLIIRGNTLLIEPILRPKTILSEEQECLLRIVAGYQRQFNAPKLIIARDGTATFPPQNGAANVALELFGPQKPEVRRSVDFEIVMDSLPAEYLRRIPEFRLDNPFVVAVTPEGFKYLGISSRTHL